MRSTSSFGFMVLVMIGMLLAMPTVAQQPVEPTPVANGPTIAAILARGEVSCGVNQDLPGFGYLDPNTGDLTGFDIDLCRALAAAIFGDATAARLEIQPSAEDGIAALRDGTVDVLLRNMTWTLTGEQSGLLFGPPTFYNGQSIMVRGDSTAEVWTDLEGATVCVVEGGIAQEHIGTALDAQAVTAQLVSFPTAEEALQALGDGRCQAMSHDRLQLEILRRQSGGEQAYRVWDDPAQLYTHEPFVPVIRYDDDQWANVVTWTVLGLIQAEQIGVSSENVNLLTRGVEEEQAVYSDRVGPDVARLLDPQSEVGGSIGMPANFMLRVIREVGNYGEIFNRHFGPDSDLPMSRGLNALWRDGGLLYAPDWR